jgi:hypothetical protein
LKRPAGQLTRGISAVNCPSASGITVMSAGVHAATPSFLKVNPTVCCVVIGAPF